MTAPRSTNTGDIILNESRYGVTRRIGEKGLIKTHTVTPDYAGIVSRGEMLPENAYYLKKYERRSDWFRTATTLDNFRKGIYSGAETLRMSKGLIVYEEDTSAAARAQAMQKFFSNADKYQSNVGVTVAELPKTIGLIADTATKLAHFYTRLKRFDVLGAFRALGLSGKQAGFKKLEAKARSLPRSQKFRDQFASETALEVNYGWKPLLGEVHSAAEDLAKALHNADGKELRIRGGARVDGQLRINNSTMGSGGPGFPGGSIQFNGPKICMSQAGVLCYASIMNAQQRTLAGMGVTNPLEIGWELLPFSFVVDWFIPIGAWISSLDALSGLTFKGGSESLLKKVQWTVGYYGLSDGGYYVVTVHRGETQTYNFVEFRRTVLTAFPSTFSQFNVKGISDALSTTRAINAISLLHLAVRGRK